MSFQFNGYKWTHWTHGHALIDIGFKELGWVLTEITMTPPGLHKEIVIDPETFEIVPKIVFRRKKFERARPI